MTKKELAEIKRRFTLDHNNITCIRGCYVNSQGEVISAFSHALVGMAQADAATTRLLRSRRASSRPAPGRRP